MTDTSWRFERLRSTGLLVAEAFCIAALLHCGGVWAPVLAVQTPQMQRIWESPLLLHYSIPPAPHAAPVPGGDQPGGSLCDGSTVSPWDHWEGGNEQNYTGPVACVGGTRGRFGNVLFFVAAAVAMAVTERIPLYVPPGGASFKGAVFECLRSSRGLPEQATPSCKQLPGGKHSYHQILTEWGLPTGSLRPAMRQALYVRPINGSGILPGPNDLVLYFRSYNEKSAGKSGPGSQLIRGHSLNFPPLAFFAAAVKEHERRLGVGAATATAPVAGEATTTLWLVTEPRVRRHPTVRRLEAELKAKVFTGFDEAKVGWLGDFQFIQAARHIAISPSTFGWWAGFLSDASTVYLPIMPSGLAVPWCPLFPQDDERFQYYDWWGGGPQREAEAPARWLQNYAEAVQLCNEYTACKTPKSPFQGNSTEKLRLLEEIFYPELLADGT